MTLRTLRTLKKREPRTEKKMTLGIMLSIKRGKRERSRKDLWCL